MRGGPIFRGSTDVVLSGDGWARLLTAPMRRCRDFARDLVETRDVTLTVGERFREMHFGDWEGVPISDVWTENPVAARAW